MKEYEKEGFEKDNPFSYVQYGDRRNLLRILFPTVDHDLLFNVEMDNESLLDDFNIPHKVYGVMPYIITHDDKLRDYLYEKCYEYRETMEYLKRDHIKEMEDMLTEINEEINKGILTKLLNQDKDE